jgi:hypothetical protein
MNVILFLKDRLKKIEEQSIEIEKRLKKEELLKKNDKNNKK